MPTHTHHLVHEDNAHHTHTHKHACTHTCMHTHNTYTYTHTQTHLLDHLASPAHTRQSDSPLWQRPVLQSQVCCDGPHPQGWSHTCNSSIAMSFVKITWKQESSIAMSFAKITWNHESSIAMSFAKITWKHESSIAMLFAKITWNQESSIAMLFAKITWKHESVNNLICTCIRKYTRKELGFVCTVNHNENIQVWQPYTVTILGYCPFFSTTLTVWYRQGHQCILATCCIPGCHSQLAAGLIMVHGSSMLRWHSASRRPPRWGNCWRFLGNQCR